MSSMPPKRIVVAKEPDSVPDLDAEWVSYVREDDHVAAVEQARREERAAIVKWLRKRMTRGYSDAYADAIARGEHLEGRT